MGYVQIVYSVILVKLEALHWYMIAYILYIEFSKKSILQVPKYWNLSDEQY